MIEFNKITNLFAKPNQAYLIFGCFTIRQGVNGFTKKIVSIQCKNLASTDSREFSIEKTATKNDITLDDINDWFDDLELHVLDEFNSFLKEKAECSFLYYSEDGKGLILDEIKRLFENANKQESKKIFIDVPQVRRIDIPSLFNYTENERELKGFLLKHNNNQLPAYFLSVGEEEVSFDNKQFNKVRNSINCKIDCLIKILSENKESNNTKNVSNPIDIEEITFGKLMKNLTLKSWLILLGIASGIFLFGTQFNYLLSEHQAKGLKIDKESLEERLSTDSINFQKENCSLLIQFIKYMIRLRWKRMLQKKSKKKKKTQ